MGRPPSAEPKEYNTRIRTSKTDVEKLNFCSDVLGITRAEVIRQGIDIMYEKAKKRK
jgi:hypothetical protein